MTCKSNIMDPGLKTISVILANSLKILKLNEIISLSLKLTDILA